MPKAMAFIPESRRDKMAVTRLWFTVAISQIKGYRPVLLREGQETAVLARNQGNVRLHGLTTWGTRPEGRRRTAPGPTARAASQAGGPEY